MNTAAAPQSDSVALYQQAIETLRELLDEARAAGDPEPTAMSLATVDAEGRVSSRIVLLKGLGEDGLRFFTNYESAKAGQLAAHEQAARRLPLEDPARPGPGARRRRGRQTWERPIPTPISPRARA